MIDREHDSINWGMIIIFIGLAYYWVNVYYYGFFLTTIWSIVIVAIVALYLRLSGRV